MKNIFEIMEANKIALPEGFDKDAFEKDVLGNYKTVAELDKKTDRIKELETQLETAKNGLKKFEGVDIDAINATNGKLKKDLEDREKQYNDKVANLEFSYKLDNAITSAKGKNTKAIKALLDVDALKQSQNQTEDIGKAIEALKKDNDYLFDTDQTPPPYSNGTGKGGAGGRYSSDELAFRKAAGLPIKD